MKRLAVLTLIILLLVSGMLLLDDSHATTPVSGTIISDTVWTNADSPYLLTGTLYVPTNLTLTIQPGATVIFSGSSYLQVNGTLNARGTPGSNIIFTTDGSNVYATPQVQFGGNSTSWDEQTGSGCIIESATFTGVSLRISGSPKIDNNNFNSLNTQISIAGGSPLITSNSITIQTTGISATGGNPIISYNSIVGNGSQYQYGIMAYGNASIFNNNIVDCSMGIYMSSNGNKSVQGNLILNNLYGIEVYANATIQNNLIGGNYYGIVAAYGGGGLIQNNTITDNWDGIYYPVTSALITYNNIFGNTQNNIALSTPVNVNATYNWWGTTDTQAINQTIYDFKNNPSLGNVTFVPFLTDLNPSAPSVQGVNIGPIPTPTPTPPYTTPHPTLPPTNKTTQPTQAPTATPSPSPSPTPTPTPNPTPEPTKFYSAIMETLAQFDITQIPKLILIGLALMWLIIIITYVSRQFIKKESKNQ